MYLIFFGKSSSFIFYAYDKNGLVENFHKIFPDFELLESQLLITDSEDNKDIFAKYVFTRGNSEPFTLIKIYSPVQPHQGHRIEGCIYGIAFLSKDNLSISQKNIEALKNIQNDFSNKVLTGIKFNKNDFREEATLVFNDFKEKIGFERIDFTKHLNSELSKKTFAVFANKLTEFDIDVSKYSERIYITEDLERLIRARNKWGKDKISIFQVANNEIKEYESTSNTNSLTHKSNTKFSDNELDNEQQLLKIRIKDLEKQSIFLEQKIQSLIIKNKNYIKYIRILTLLIFFSILFLTYIIIKSEASKKIIQDLIIEPKNSSIKTSLTIDNSFDIINMWDNKNDLANIINLITRLDTAKKQSERFNIINQIFKSSSINKLDTTKVRIFLKNYQTSHE